MKKMIFFYLLITVTYSSMLLCGEGQSPAPAALQSSAELQVAVDHQNIPMEMLNGNHPSLSTGESQNRIYREVRHRRENTALGYCCRFLTFTAVMGVATYMLVQGLSNSAEPAEPCTSISGNNTMTNCWQVVATNCGDCPDSEESDVQCAPKNVTRDQVNQKVMADLNPICGPKASICVKEAAECSIANAQCTKNYSSFRGYLDQKCKPNPQSRKPRQHNQARLPRTKFKHKYR